MNVRLAAGVAILALVFAGWFAGMAIDEGLLFALAVLGGVVLIVALIGVAVKLISDGMDQR